MVITTASVVYVNEGITPLLCCPRRTRPITSVETIETCIRYKPRREARFPRSQQICSNNGRRSKILHSRYCLHETTYLHSPRLKTFFSFSYSNDSTTNNTAAWSHQYFMQRFKFVSFIFLFVIRSNLKLNVSLCIGIQ